MTHLKLRKSSLEETLRTAVMASWGVGETSIYPRCRIRGLGKGVFVSENTIEAQLVAGRPIGLL